MTKPVRRLARRPSGDGGSSTTHVAPPMTEPAPSTARRPSGDRARSFVPPRTTSVAQDHSTSTPTSSSAPRRGVMGYFTAGRNAGPGRDKNVGPLDG